jgi:hypothetical protein
MAGHHNRRRSRRRLFAAGLMVAVLFPLCSLHAEAADQEGPPMGPSYLAAQAERGLNLYVSKCANAAKRSG